MSSKKRPSPQVRALQAARLIAKHEEFEAAAAALGPKARRIVWLSPRGFDQHVVSKGTAMLRWPTSYKEGKEPLYDMVAEAEENIAAEIAAAKGEAA